MPEVQVNGETLHYAESGKGMPLVLLHGFPLDGRVWDDQLAGLADVCRVIAPDLRGFGRSRSMTPFTLDDLADDVHQLLGRIGALPCVLGGLSMGGYVTFAYLRNYAADLRGLLLMDTKCEADTPEGKDARMKMIETCRAGGAKAVAEQMEPKMMSPGASPQLKARLRRIMEECPPLTIEHALLAMRQRPDYREMLGSIAAPTLVIVGEGDAFAPPAVAMVMHRGIDACGMAIIPGAGHMAPMERPDLVNKMIRAFMEVRAARWTTETEPEIT